VLDIEMIIPDIRLGVLPAWQWGVVNERI